MTVSSLGSRLRYFFVGFLLVILLSFVLIMQFTTLKSNYLLVKYKTNHSVYTIENKKNSSLLLFAAIFSYIKNSDRRKAIRNTWLKLCNHKRNALCLFMIDGIDFKGQPLTAAQKVNITKEIKQFEDTVLLDTFEGLNFAYRFYVSMIWASSRYTFDFFLRIDDDYYVCFERLFYELPKRKEVKYIYWGYQHCEPEITRIDEGWSLFGGDLIEEFIKRKDYLQCHKYGDQAVALWILAMNANLTVTWFGDPRIMHTMDMGVLSSNESVCRGYISIHQSYPQRMVTLHQTYLKDPLDFSNYTIPKTVDQCPLLHTTFNVDRFFEPYHGNLELCMKKPIWSDAEKFVGRE